MAPKRASAKRTQEMPSSPPKKAKTGSKSGTVDPLLSCVLAALQASDLPDDCRLMLAGVAPLCLCETAPTLQELPQAMFTKMIGEVIAARRQILEQDVANERVRLADIDSLQTARQIKVDEADAALSGCAADFEEKTKALAAATAAMMDAKKDVEGKSTNQRSIDVEIAELGKEKSSIQQALSENFGPLKAGGCEDSVSQMHIAALMPLAKRCKLDDSLATALPSALSKQSGDRGSFEQIVVDQLGVQLEQKIVELAQTIEAKEVSRKEIIVDIGNAQKKADEATEAQMKAATELQTAKKLNDEAAATLRDARVVVATGKSERQQVVDSVSAKEVPLEAFVSTTAAGFEAFMAKCK